MKPVNMMLSNSFKHTLVMAHQEAVVMGGVDCLVDVDTLALPEMFNFLSKGLEVLTSYLIEGT